MRLVICAKSTWHPAIRREHAIATSAAAAGHEVVFVERALDARALAHAEGRRAWRCGFSDRHSSAARGVQVAAQSTLVPGHRSDVAQWIDGRRLAATLRRLPGSVVVATQPWQWPAVAAAPAARRVFDGADDWAALIPRRRAAIIALHSRIAREADAVIVASQRLAGAFRQARELAIVPNGTGRELLAAPVTPIPTARRLVYAGTLSERFDAPLIAAVLGRLPGWSLELYGQCQYAGRGDAPGPELIALLDGAGGRVSWHGVVARGALAGVLDRGRVLIAPHRGRIAGGQDSIKLYDYAARQRPVVCTPGAFGGAPLPVGVRPADTAERFAAFVAEATRPKGLREWAWSCRWEARWPAWERTALGA